MILLSVQSHPFLTKLRLSLFVMEMLQLTVNTDDGAPVAAADLTAIGRAIRSAWINFTKNG